MDELSIGGIQDRFSSGELTAQGLAEAYLARIEAIDRSGLRLNAIIELNPEALDIAQSLDVERRQQGPRGPLHGVPVILKDNIDTADRMTTTAGSLALEGSVPVEDAFIVRRLRRAGALILGKANLSEWANFRSTRSTSGWSSRGGQTRNPYALDRSPCGSSSGSAVAVAANLCALAVGTETDGSIVCPAAMNGIVGIKPTVGLLSRSGIVPIAHSQDTAGPMARTVADAAVLLGFLAGPDPRDSATLGAGDRLSVAGNQLPAIGDQLSVSGGRIAQPDDRSPATNRQSPVTDYTQFLDPNGLRGARVGVARNFFGKHPLVDEVMEASLALMAGLGAELVDPAPVATADELDEPEMTVLLYEFKADLNAYLAGLGPAAPVKSLEEAIEFNQRHGDRVMPYFGQELFLQAQEKGPLTDEAYLQALAESKRLAGAEGIDAVLQEHRLDALVAPTTGPAWLVDLVNGDHYSGSCSSLAAVAGYPHITVPAGYVFGLPVGISFFSSAYQEPTLIRLAYAFELATQARRPPRFLASVIA